MQIISTKKIWDQAEHSAFPDLCLFRGRFFCAFRTSDTHQDGRLGQLQIISSRDTNRWVLLAELSLPGYDLRDPKLSITKKGKLHLLFCAVRFDGEGKVVERVPGISFSRDGENWPALSLLHEHSNEWIWRITWNTDRSIAYGLSYRVDPQNPCEPWLLSLFQTKDGATFKRIRGLLLHDLRPSEATLRFDQDKRLIALLRGQDSGFIGTSEPPYLDWVWTPIPYHLGGPNFVIRENGQMVAASGFFEQELDESWIGEVMLAIFNESGCTPVLSLPSGGDCSYPGIVDLGDRLCIAYYSSHEEKAAIYFSIIEPSAHF